MSRGHHCVKRPDFKPSTSQREDNRHLYTWSKEDGYRFFRVDDIVDDELTVCELLTRPATDGGWPWEEVGRYKVDSMAMETRRMQKSEPRGYAVIVQGEVYAMGETLLQNC